MEGTPAIENFIDFIITSRANPTFDQFLTLAELSLELTCSQPNMDDLNSDYTVIHHFHAFNQWLIQNNVDLNHIELSKSDYGYGVFAVSKIENEQIMTTIPRHLMIISDFSHFPELETLIKSDILLR
jgi:hypothetical protein